MPEKSVVNTLRPDQSLTVLIWRSCFLLKGAIFQTAELFHSSSKHIIEFIRLGSAMLMRTSSVTNAVMFIWSFCHWTHQGQSSEDTNHNYILFPYFKNYLFPFTPIRRIMIPFTLHPPSTFLPAYGFPQFRRSWRCHTAVGDLHSWCYFTNKGGITETFGELDFMLPKNQRTDSTVWAENVKSLSMKDICFQELRLPLQCWLQNALHKTMIARNGTKSSTVAFKHGVKTTSQ